jgi:hypothetical protein
MFPAVTSAQAKVHLDLFFSPTCPHCIAEESYLKDLQTKYPQLEVAKYDVTDQVNEKLIITFYNKLQVPQEDWGLVPANFINDKFFIGFDNGIQDYLNSQLTGYIPTATTSSPVGGITIPFLGHIRTSGISSLVLAIVLGFLDGLNPCALAALGFLLALAAATGDRKKIFWIGGTFIAVSGLILFFFISVWLNVFMFLGQIRWITIAIGALVIVFAGVILNEYLKNIFCKLCDSDNDKKLTVRWQRKFFGFLTELSQMDRSLPVILLGVAAVAAGLNLIQAVCSIGLPLAFTKTLSSQNLSTWKYYAYLLVYILFYVINQIIIFLIALFTLKATHIENKYFKVVKLVSGFALLILGVIMIFRAF